MYEERSSRWSQTYVPFAVYLMSLKGTHLTTRVYQWRFLESDIISLTNVAIFSAVYNAGANPAHQVWTGLTPFLLAMSAHRPNSPRFSRPRPNPSTRRPKHDTRTGRKMDGPDLEFLPSMEYVDIIKEEFIG